ncbi:MAG: DUF4129 domain-containing protein [bacterium]
MGPIDSPVDRWYPTPEEIRQTTQRILERPEFAEGSGTKSWIERLWDYFVSILEAVARWGSAHPAAQKILISLLVVILLGLIVFILITILRDFGLVQGPRRPRSLGTSVAALLDGGSRSWEDAFASAESAFTSGDHYRAVWIGHRLYLALLDFAGVIKFAKWKTNRDYVNECGHDDVRCHTLRDLTATYENIVYAHRATDPGRVRQFLDRVDEMRVDEMR